MSICLDSRAVKFFPCFMTVKYAPFIINFHNSGSTRSGILFASLHRARANQDFAQWLHSMSSMPFSSSSYKIKRPCHNFCVTQPNRVAKRVLVFIGIRVKQCLCIQGEDAVDLCREAKQLGSSNFRTYMDIS